MKKHSVALVGASGLGALALVFGGAAAASAHVGVTSDSHEAGAYAIATLSVPHGCGDSPTTRIAIKMPDGVNSVTPTRNAFYTAEKVRETLATPITDSHGNQITERIAEVVYTAITPLPADQRDTFELSVKLPDDAAGSTLYFPTVQTCEEGETAWVQLPAEGQDPHELALPAPSIEVVAASGEGHGDGASAGAEAGGSDAQASAAESQRRLTVSALALGAIGVLAGGMALFRTTKKS